MHRDNIRQWHGIDGSVRVSYLSRGLLRRLAICVAVTSALLTPRVYAVASQDDENASQGLTFKGYPCKGDCAGHEAGYTWAEKRHITDRQHCGGASQSFIEGCYAYVDENQGQWEFAIVFCCILGLCFYLHRRNLEFPSKTLLRLAVIVLGWPLVVWLIIIAWRFLDPL